MNSATLVSPLLVGGLLGLLGQSVRVIVGLKKTYDFSQQQNNTFKQSFDGTQLLISLLIGFVAGALGTLVQLNFKDDFIWTKDLTVEIIAVGYAGADFIEGFMKKFLPSSTGSANDGAPGKTEASTGQAPATDGAANTGQPAAPATALSKDVSTEDIAG